MSLKDKKQRKKLTESFKVIKEEKQSPELLFKFTFVHHIPPSSMPPIAEPRQSFQAKRELAILLDVKRQPWKRQRKITVLKQN